MGRASVKGFGQVKFPGEDLILHRLLRHKFRSLLFLFHCTRTSGLKDTPCTGFALPSVVSRMAATLCLVQIWSWVPIFHAYSAIADNLRASGISRNLVPARDLVVPVVRCSAFLRQIKFWNYFTQTVAGELCTWRNGVPSRHMRCKTTPIRRASAIKARFDPRRWATLSAQAWSQFGDPRCIKIIAA